MIRFERITRLPLAEFTAMAPDGAVIGLIGENGSGCSTLLRIAAGAEQPESGSVEIPEAKRLLGPNDQLNFAPAKVLLLDQALAQQDWLVRGRAAVALSRLRQAGATVLLASHDDEILQNWCDEIWWLHDGKLAGRGDPAEMLIAYRRHVAQKLRAWGNAVVAPVAPRLRRGDGRAAIAGVELLGVTGEPTIVWRSGEVVTVRVAVQFHAAVDAPVIGMLIRTRIGLNVYGTNTELEKLNFGPCAANDSVRISFTFRCDLCPAEYTLTVASHDPDGLWHEWLEDAVAFSVADSRFTAGVANLRAVAGFERLE